MKIYKRILFLVLFIIFTYRSILSCEAESNSESIPIRLKMNEYYVLYTNPIAPYINSQNNMMVPLNTFCELLGAQITYANKNKSIKVCFAKHYVQFIPGSKIAIVDGEKRILKSNPIVQNNAVIIPVYILVNSFKIKNNWDQKEHLLTLTDRRIIKPLVIGDFETSRHDYFVYDAFNLSSYKIKKINNISSQLEITAKNILGVDIPAENEDIHPVYIYKNAVSWEPISRPQRPRPAVKKDATIKIADGNYMTLKDLKYIVVVARVWNGKFGEKPWYPGTR